MHLTSVEGSTHFKSVKGPHTLEECEEFRKLEESGRFMLFNGVEGSTNLKSVEGSKLLKSVKGFTNLNTMKGPMLVKSRGFSQT